MFNLLQQLQEELVGGETGAAKEEVQRLRDEVSRQCKAADRDLVKLWEDVLDLKLYVATLFRLWLTKKLASAGELRQFVEALEGEDGVFRGDVLPNDPA